MTAEFPASVRRLVYLRAWFACERDGRTDGLQLHHRRPRQAGGTTDPAASRASNALLLCATCHRWVESNRRAALSAGWLVPTETDPVTVPALVYELRGRAVLTEHGTYEPHRGAC